MDNFNQKDHTKNEGVAVDATPPETQTTKPNYTDNSTKHQCIKLLDWLFERGSITSSEARERLDIYYPPARIFELRQAGYLIVTIWDNWTSEYGIKHRIARYVLTQKQPLETVNARGVA